MYQHTHTSRTLCKRASDPAVLLRPILSTVFRAVFRNVFSRCISVRRRKYSEDRLYFAFLERWTSSRSRCIYLPAGVPLSLQYRPPGGPHPPHHPIKIRSSSIPQPIDFTFQYRILPPHPSIWHINLYIIRQ